MQMYLYCIVHAMYWECMTADEYRCASELVTPGW